MTCTAGRLSASPGVVELQRQVVPVLVVRRDHRLQGAGIVASPAVAQVHHPVLAPAQLSAQLRLSCQEKQTKTNKKKVLVGVWGTASVVGGASGLGFLTSQKRSHVPDQPVLLAVTHSPCSSTSLRERLSRDRRASRGAWSFLTRNHRSSVRSSRPVCLSSSCRQQTHNFTGQDSEHRLDASCHLQVLCCGTFKPKSHQILVGLHFPSFRLSPPSPQGRHESVMATVEADLQRWSVLTSEGRLS